MGSLAHLRQLFADARQASELRARERRGRFSPRAPRDEDLEVVARAEEGELAVAFAAETDRDVERCLDLADEAGLRPLIVGARRAGRLAGLLRARSIPLVATLAWPNEPKPITLEDAPAKKAPPAGGSRVKGPFRLGAGRTGSLPPLALTKKVEAPAKHDPLSMSARELEERKRDRREEVEALAHFWSAGVRPIAVGSRGLEKPALVLARLREAIEHGLPEDAALETLTTGPAELLGLADRLGTLDPGMLANATVLSAPLSDKNAKVRFVVIDGERLDVEKEEGGAPVEPKSLAGTWTLESRRLGNGTLKLTVEGNAIKGTLDIPGMGTATVEGTIDGSKITAKASLGEHSMDIEARIEGDQMVGSARVAGGGPGGRFTGRRAPEEDER
jgi:hypothetical protein